jgi:hypothetical protein
MKTIKENPILTIVVTIICTALTIFITETFASVSYVDREIKKTEARYIKDAEEMKTMISKIDGRVFEIWKNIPKKIKE